MNKTDICTFIRTINRCIGRVDLSPFSYPHFVCKSDFVTYMYPHFVNHTGTVLRLSPFRLLIARRSAQSLIPSWYSHIIIAN